MHKFGIIFMLETFLNNAYYDNDLNFLENIFFNVDATWDNVKSTLKQRCVFQSWNLRLRTTSNQGFVFQCCYEQR